MITFLFIEAATTGGENAFVGSDQGTHFSSILDDVVVPHLSLVDRDLSLQILSRFMRFGLGASLSFSIKAPKP